MTIKAFKRKNGRKLKSFFTIVVLLSLGYGLIKAYLSFDINSAHSEEKTEIKKTEPKDSSKTLGEAVNKSMQGTQGDYSVAIKNLKTGETFFLNEHKQFDTGSLYKLWIMGETYRQIEKGDLSEDEQMDEDVADLNETFGIDPADAELTDGTISLTVSEALNQMITISHNYAALLLTKKIKLSSVKKYLNDLDLPESEVGDIPKTSAFDMLQFYEKLYAGQLGNKDSTAKMTQLLKAQTFNDKIPKNLPEGIKVAHKTGELGGFSHDAGIVFAPKGDYIIVVLSDSDFPPGAEERIAMISRAVYDYFEKDI